MNLAAFAGAGVGVNDFEAYKWTLVAAAQGMDLAKNRIPKLERDLSLDQRAEGKRLATEWQAKLKNRIQQNNRGNRQTGCAKLL